MVGLLLNPMKKRRTAKRRKLSDWQKMVKKHGGVMQAVAARKKAKAAAKKRKRSAPKRKKSSKAATPTRKRAKTPARKRSHSAPRRPARSAKRRKSMAKTKKRKASRRPSRKTARRAAPERKARKKTSWKRRMASLPLIRQKRPFMLLANPRRRPKRRRNPMRGSRTYRRNPVSLGVLKGAVSKSQMQKYPWLIGGVVAGGVAPRLLVAAAQRVGVNLPSGAAGNIMLGLAGTALAGVLANLKGKEEARLVIAGGISGVIGSALIGVLDTYMPMMGLGAAPSTDVRRAVEAQVRKALGDFVLPEDIAAAPTVSGMQDFVLPEDVAAAPVVSGFGQDVAEGAEGFGGFDGDTF